MNTMNLVSGSVFIDIVFCNLLFHTDVNEHTCAGCFHAYVWIISTFLYTGVMVLS